MTDIIPFARLMQGNEAIAEGAAAGARFLPGIRSPLLLR